MAFTVHYGLFSNGYAIKYSVDNYSMIAQVTIPVEQIVHYVLAGLMGLASLAFWAFVREMQGKFKSIEDRREADQRTIDLRLQYSGKLSSDLASKVQILMDLREQVTATDLENLQRDVELLRSTISSLQQITARHDERLSRYGKTGV